MAAFVGAVGMNDRYCGWSVVMQAGREHVLEEREGARRADAALVDRASGEPGELELGDGLVERGVVGEDAPARVVEHEVDEVGRLVGGGVHARRIGGSGLRCGCAGFGVVAGTHGWSSHESGRRCGRRARGPEQRCTRVAVERKITQLNRDCGARSLRAAMVRRMKPRIGSGRNRWPMRPIRGSTDADHLIGGYTCTEEPS